MLILIRQTYSIRTSYSRVADSRRGHLQNFHFFRPPGAYQNPSAVISNFSLSLTTVSEVLNTWNIVFCELCFSVAFLYDFGIRMCSVRHRARDLSAIFGSKSFSLFRRWQGGRRIKGNGDKVWQGGGVKNWYFYGHILFERPPRGIRNTAFTKVFRTNHARKLPEIHVNAKFTRSCSTPDWTITH